MCCLAPCSMRAGAPGLHRRQPSSTAEVLSIGRRNSSLQPAPPQQQPLERLSRPLHAPHHIREAVSCRLHIPTRPARLRRLHRLRPQLRRDTGRAERRLDDAAGQRPKRRLTRAICCISQRPCGRCQEGSWRVCVWLSWGGTAEAGAPAFWGKGATCSENVGARAAFIYT